MAEAAPLALEEMTPEAQASLAKQNPDFRDLLGSKMADRMRAQGHRVIQPSEIEGLLPQPQAKAKAPSSGSPSPSSPAPLSPGRVSIPTLVSSAGSAPGQLVGPAGGRGRALGRLASALFVGGGVLVVMTQLVGKQWGLNLGQGSFGSKPLPDYQPRPLYGATAGGFAAGLGPQPDAPEAPAPPAPPASPAPHSSSPSRPSPRPGPAPTLPTGFLT